MTRAMHNDCLDRTVTNPFDMTGLTTISADTKPLMPALPTSHGRTRVTSSALPRAGTKRAGWFANRPLAVKFGILVGVVLLAFGNVLVSVLAGNASVREANEELN